MRLVRLELTERGRVIDIHCLSVEMAFDENPRMEPGYVIQVMERLEDPIGRCARMRLPVRLLHPRQQVQRTCHMESS
jgi:hypothetical protein